MRQTTQNARHGIHWTMFSQLEDLDYADDVALWLQTTQPTSGGAVTANSNCCANCV